MTFESPERYKPNNFDPPYSWEHRLGRHDGSRATGHPMIPELYNILMYEESSQPLECHATQANSKLTDKRVLDTDAAFIYITTKSIQKLTLEIVTIDLNSVSIEYLENNYPEHNYPQTNIAENEASLHHSIDIVLASNEFFHILDNVEIRHAVENLCRCAKPVDYLALANSVQINMLPTARLTQLHTVSLNKGIHIKAEGTIISRYPMLLVMGNISFHTLGQVQSLKPVISIVAALERELWSICRYNPSAPTFLSARWN